MPGPEKRESEKNIDIDTNPEKIKMDQTFQNQLKRFQQSNDNKEGPRKADTGEYGTNYIINCPINENGVESVKMQMSIITKDETLSEIKSGTMLLEKNYKNGITKYLTINYNVNTGDCSYNTAEINHNSDLPSSHGEEKIDITNNLTLQKYLIPFKERQDEINQNNQNKKYQKTQKLMYLGSVDSKKADEELETNLNNLA